MSLFEIFDANYGDGIYQSVPDGIGGADIIHDGTVVDHMNSDGVFHSHGAAISTHNVEGGVNIVSDGHLVVHTHPNVMGGHDVYGSDGLHHVSIPNVHGGVDIYDGDMHLEGMTMPNVLGGEDYWSMSGNADTILNYDDPLMHSSEYVMDPFTAGLK